ncbi:MAG: Mur ligase family protein, partial [Candidatus Omnitrophota bacterium]|nr:Mur ligase family protein [Candidatus Omnitrophota bacterium]
RERIRINDCLISEEDVVRLLEKVKVAVNNIKGVMPSFFEVYTAVCYLYFKEKNVDFAVYEVGLGGRLDATNIIDPLVSAITPISYEHMDKLGNTLREIASEKAGIVKNGGICVSAPQTEEADEAIEDICCKRNARLIRVGQEIIFKEISANDMKEVFEVSGLFDKYEGLETFLMGPHQVLNAAVAIGVIEALRFKGVEISKGAVRQGIGRARWEGRLEVIRKRPFIILDGAQNRASAGALAVAIQRFKYKRLLLVLGVSKDKDIEGILEELLPISDQLILTKSRIAERALEPSKIRKFIKDTKYKDMETIQTVSVKEALDKAASYAAEHDMILITGSLFVVGEARKRLMASQALPRALRR